MGRPRKLSAETERLILLRVLLRKRLSNRALATRYGVSPATVSNIGAERGRALRAKFRGAGLD